jgi:hypothetical protein
MPSNYVLLEKVTVGAAGASSVTFSSIPQTGYTDLVLKISARAVGVDNQLTFNGSTTSDSSRYLIGTGSSAISGADGSNIQLQGTPESGFTANTFGSMDIYIPNYASSNNKSVSIDTVTENNATTSYQFLGAGLWASSAAITSITVTNNSGPYTQYSTFYLYGIAKLGVDPVIAPKATGGDIIESDGTYWYHAFLSSGTFTPSRTLSCDYLVVAGGGGTGTDFTSGAGAGGYRSTTAQSIASALAVTVGAGGSGGSGGGGGTSGSNSSFNSFSATGGGRSGTTGAAGVTGGSGSGAPIGSAQSGAAGNAGGYTPVEGYKGGDGTGSGVPRSTGGGGGAGGAGGNGNNSGNGGAGGVGSNAHSSWLSVVGLGVSGYLAGGGGGTGESLGTAGGSGGGGTGGNQGNGALGKGTNGTANTGSGGGGGGNGGGNGSAGGSGLVIVRYTVA